jgi:hypothetical protein
MVRLDNENILRWANHEFIYNFIYSSIYFDLRNC